MTNLTPQFVPGAVNAGECVSNAWEQVKRNYGMYLGVVVVALIMTACIPCLNLFIVGPIMGGIFYIALRDMRREPVEFGMLFKGFEKFVPLMVIGLIQAIPGIIAQIVQITVRLGALGLGRGRRGGLDFYQQSADPDLAIASGLLIIIAIVGVVFFIFALVWWAVFFFAIPLAFEHDLKPLDAIKLSARAALGNVGGLIVLLIFESLIVIIGGLMCGIGIILISVPIIYVANAFAYRQVFPHVPEFNVTPPPPASYGSNFGQGME